LRRCHCRHCGYSNEEAAKFLKSVTHKVQGVQTKLTHEQYNALVKWHRLCNDFRKLRDSTIPSGDNAQKLFVTAGDWRSMDAKPTEVSWRCHAFLICLCRLLKYCKASRTHTFNCAAMHVYFLLSHSCNAHAALRSISLLCTASQPHSYTLSRICTAAKHSCTLSCAVHAFLKHAVSQLYSCGAAQMRVSGMRDTGNCPVSHLPQLHSILSCHSARIPETRSYTAAELRSCVFQECVTLAYFQCRIGHCRAAYCSAHCTHSSCTAPQLWSCWRLFHNLPNN
jgi:hypothetical protein